VLEGGSIDVNGEGLLLTTEECLLSPVQARNPGLTQAKLEQVLGEYLGVRKVLWLNRGIAGDDTHGHVDDLARFVGPRTVVVVTE
ncbi:agmatine deiminase family protein, partial [Salmonella sp. SAL4438]|uniref:agmatine deiminase family protein n=1 Tax=Salmonella sp. SAL4438 TaxID=3159893 RepID=UPI00397C3B5E